MHHYTSSVSVGQFGAREKVRQSCASSILQNINRRQSLATANETLRMRVTVLNVHD